jgi:uncharacterized protein (TIGR02266 family)
MRRLARRSLTSFWRNANRSLRELGVRTLTGRRVHERFEYELPVTVVHDGTEHETVSHNISLGGMYLLTDVQLKYGSQVKLRFRLPTLKEDTECEGVVRWVKDDGIGVQFASLRALEVWGLNQLFNKRRSG